MRLTLAAVGRWKRGPLPELFEDYRKRLAWPLALKQVSARKPLEGDQLKAHEAELLRAALPEQATLVALDAGGTELSSRAFADRLGAWEDHGVGEVAFAIGGAEGLDSGLLQRADLKLSLGAMTWPHMLVRVLLAEQLYRAQAIRQGHPYHK
ncbi:23S rRNA (pseudouridine(1915)-N(3))-methyltransferase RlmH [Rhodovibrio sodomensis]|uniref:Ribosomal RNA large subunit methyltransferase H n=1 Tax=Rhodovibrio sodomensis TaxID=1088 RepID=A0ABS1DIA3_9PROT|nr:23S rRNA (pseudouridine(1915)-N(3))-methyltransferase RlmH [Rhodovibrio sodomensis]MBK1669243.1 23S rRNA (pseudouridine(1915)-N(3))-methyltransferase RlmH [Rhodovibrio sodomensis]